MAQAIMVGPEVTSTEGTSHTVSAIRKQSGQEVGPDSMTARPTPIAHFLQ